MALTPEQVDRLERLTEDEWEDRAEFDAFFDSVTDPEELHLFADGYNWDNGRDVLRRVVQHPLCDLGTALLVYWRGGPAYYLRYADPSGVPAYERDGYDFVQEVESRILSGHYGSARLPFDPRNDAGTDLTREYRKEALPGRTLPAEVYVPTQRATG